MLGKMQMLMSVNPSDGFKSLKITIDENLQTKYEEFDPDISLSLACLLNNDPYFNHEFFKFRQKLIDIKKKLFSKNHFNSVHFGNQIIIH